MNSFTCIFKRQIKTIFKFIFLYSLFFSLTVSYAANGTIISTTQESSSVAFAPGFPPSEPCSQTWHYQNSTFMVWVDSLFRPWITQVTNGKETTVPLDTNPDYTTQQDGHHRYSLGVDKDG